MTTDLKTELIRDARVFFDFGWLLGTSGNLSFRDEETFIITRSGAHKGELSMDDFVQCRTIDATPLERKKPSAETLLHGEIYRAFPTVGAVYHVHDPFAALCGRRDGNHTEISGFEMIKGLGIWEEDACVQIPIIDNHADIPTLARAVHRELHLTGVPGINIRGHGIYAWGATPFEARRHIETFGYLFKVSFLES